MISDICRVLQGDAFSQKNVEMTSWHRMTLSHTYKTWKKTTPWDPLRASRLRNFQDTPWPWHAMLGLRTKRWAAPWCRRCCAQHRDASGGGATWTGQPGHPSCTGCKGSTFFFFWPYGLMMFDVFYVCDMGLWWLGIRLRCIEWSWQILWTCHGSWVVACNLLKSG